MIRNDGNGFSGGTTVRIGESHLTIGGHVARSDIRRLRTFLNRVERYYETAGYDSGDLFGDIEKGVNVVRDLANSPAGAALVGVAGPYGAAALAAANGAALGIEALKRAGIPSEYATMVAKLDHPDPKVAAEATRVTDNLTAAAAKGDVRAKQIRLNLQKMLMVHNLNKLRETQAALAACQERLAWYGDPLAYEMPAMRGGGAPAFTAGPAPIPPELRDAVNRALARMRLSPQPSFRGLLTRSYA